MPDMLVNLLKLPSPDEASAGARAAGVTVRRARAYEITPVREFVAANFGAAWADEISVGYTNKPVSIYIATRAGTIVGFAAYECTRRAFFGPTGVVESERGRGIGRALLVASLWGLRALGYAYGIIGGVGPSEFYARAVGAIIIPDSTPGIYRDPLRRDGL